MTIRQSASDFGVIIINSEFLENGVVNVTLNNFYKHNYICQTALKLDCPILGHPTADYVNEAYVDILGVAYLPFENQEVCFFVVDSFYSNTWQVAPAILGRNSCVDLGIVESFNWQSSFHPP